MKKIKLLIVALISCHFLVAQEKPLNNKNEGFLAKLKTELNLTTEQENKIKPILASNKAQLKSNRQKYKGNQKCLKKAQYQQRKKTRFEIEQVLSADQNAKWKEIQEKKKEEKRKKRMEYLNSPMEC